MMLPEQDQGLGSGPQCGDRATTHQDAPFEAAFDHQHADLQLPDVGGSAALDTARRDADTQQHAMGGDSSIITEAAPSELAISARRACRATRLIPTSAAACPSSATARRATAAHLFAMVAIGLAGLVIMTVTSLISANRGAAQVGASGQALMQSQRWRSPCRRP